MSFAVIKKLLLLNSFTMAKLKIQIETNLFPPSLSRFDQNFIFCGQKRSSKLKWIQNVGMFFGSVFLDECFRHNRFIKCYTVLLKLRLNGTDVNEQKENDLMENDLKSNYDEIITFIPNINFNFWIPHSSIAF